MNHPIKNQMNTVFVHVSDLTRAVKWYADLLGLAYDAAEITRPVYNIPITGQTGLTLDAGPEGGAKECAPSGHPLFNLHTDQIAEAFNYVNKLGCRIESDIVHFDEFSFFNISDPDGNVIMICTG